ncbi:MAG: sterol desaturase family protein [Pseudomonadota bacterium]
MNSPANENLSNRTLPARAPSARRFEKWFGLPFNALERAGSYLVVHPTQRALSALDALSHRIEGTTFRHVLSVVIFPVVMVITLMIGFEFAERGISLSSLTALSLILVTYGVIFAPIERLIPWSRKWLDGGNDLSVDLMMFYSGIFWGVVSNFLVKVLLLVQILAWLEPYGHSLWPTEIPAVAQVFLFLLLKDFFRYWYHRWMHEVPFMWRWHAVHHSVERLYWLNGIRSHPLEILVQTLLWAIPLALLQPPAEIAMISVLMALSIGIFQHANIDAKLGFWEYIFSIGDNHRYHHYNTDGIGDSNYGGEFIVWDILFGTFHNPKGDRPLENIGIGSSPNYPQTMAGLMIAPFLPDQKVFGPRQAEEDAGDSPEEHVEGVMAGRT